MRHQTQRIAEVLSRQIKEPEEVKGEVERVKVWGKWLIVVFADGRFAYYTAVVTDEDAAEIDFDGSAPDAYALWSAGLITATEHDEWASLVAAEGKRAQEQRERELYLRLKAKYEGDQHAEG